MSTREQLAEASAGENQANRKYLAFARKAEADGLPQVAKLFRAAAHARRCMPTRICAPGRYQEHR